MKLTDQCITLEERKRDMVDTYLNTGNTELAKEDLVDILGSKSELLVTLKDIYDKWKKTNGGTFITGVKNKLSSFKKVVSDIKSKSTIVKVGKYGRIIPPNEMKEANKLLRSSMPRLVKVIDKTIPHIDQVHTLIPEHEYDAIIKEYKEIVTDFKSIRKLLTPVSLLQRNEYTFDKKYKNFIKELEDIDKSTDEYMKTWKGNFDNMDSTIIKFAKSLKALPETYTNVELMGQDSFGYTYKILRILVPINKNIVKSIDAAIAVANKHK